MLKCIWVTSPSITHQVKDDDEKFFEDSLNIIDISKLSKQKRIKSYYNDFDILVINYHKISNDQKYIKDVISEYPTLIVFDEAVHIKNPTSSMGRTAKSISIMSNYVLPMTATPLMKDLNDIKGLLSVSNVYHMDDYYFKRQFCKYRKQRIRPKKIRGKIVTSVPVLVGYKNIDEFFSIINKYIFYRKKSDLSQLPPSTFKVLYCDKDKNSLRALETITGNNIFQIEKAEGYPALVLVEKLPIPPKINTIAEYIINDCDNKVFIYTKFRKTTEYLAKALEKFHDIKSVYIHGDMDTKPIRDKFINDPSVRVLVGNNSIAVGFDGMQEVADTVIFADIPDTFGLYYQIIGRVSRSGSKFNNVNIVMPVVKDSVDETRFVHIHSTISLLLRESPDQIEEGTYDENTLKTIDSVYDDEWVKSEILKRYKKEIDKTG